MSHSHQVRPLNARNPGEAADALRARGLRLTAARRHLIDALFTAEAPVSAEEIAAGLDGKVPIFDPASVYRNLETFESIGLVRHVHLGHGPGLYALAGEVAPAYLLCDECGARSAVASAELDSARDAIRESLGFEATFTHFPIVGLCSRCARARKVSHGNGNNAAAPARKDGTR